MVVEGWVVFVEVDMKGQSGWDRRGFLMGMWARGIGSRGESEAANRKRAGLCVTL